MLGSTLVIVALAAGLALAVRMGWVPGAAISFEMIVQAPQHEGVLIILPVRLVLNNPSGRLQSLPPQNACEIFRWFVLDENSAFIQSARKNNCDEAMIQRALRPWEEVEEDIIIRLDAKRFKRGRSYYLITRFWGLQQQQSFAP